jgi:hypothetical protein
MFNYRQYSYGFQDLGVVSTALVGLILGGSVTPADAQGFGNDNQGCSINAPCFSKAYQTNDGRVYFQFDEVTGWDFYNVRYPSGGGEAQLENRSGHFTINNVLPNRVYTLNVQGCHRHVLGRSDCSAWVGAQVTTR